MRQHPIAKLGAYIASFESMFADVGFWGWTHLYQTEHKWERNVGMIALILALLVLAIWLGLALAHAGFWRIEPTIVPAAPPQWPGVIVLIPARDEESGIAQTLRSL